MSTPNRPNILMAVFDSLSEATLQAHMGDLPTLRSVQSESLHFTKAFTCCPESSPARASLFTGLDIAAHGLWSDGVALPKRETPLPQVFAQNGYTSWLVGPRHLAGVSNWTTEHARAGEYLHFDWAHGPLHRSRQNAYLAWLKQTDPQTYAAIFPRQADPDDTRIAQTQHKAMADLPDHLGFNTWVGAQACDRMEGDAPFVGVLGFVVGRRMGADAALLEELDANALRQADMALAAVLERAPPDTVIVVTSGRGCVEASAQTLPLQNAAVHVPVLLRAPMRAPRQVDDIVSTIDIAPTLYEIAGLRPPQRLQGQSLTSGAARGWALCRVRHPDHTHETALISAQIKLTITHGDIKNTRLYDLNADPFEAKNLATDPAHQDRLEDMIDQMIDARAAFEDRTEPRIAMF